MSTVLIGKVEHSGPSYIVFSDYQNSQYHRGQINKQKTHFTIMQLILIYYIKIYKFSRKTVLILNTVSVLINIIILEWTESKIS